MKKYTYLIVTVIIIAFGLLFFFRGKLSELFLREQVLTPIPSSTSTPPIEATTTSGGVKINATGDYKIELLPPPELQSYPDLNRQVVLPVGVFDTEGAIIMKKNIEASISLLKKNPQDSESWYSLAIYRKVTHDYVGAKEIWEFLAQNSKNNAVVYANLGELYHLYLKDYSASELNYKKAVAIQPENISLYRGLHELYKYSYKQETTLATDILKQGIEKNPENVELVVLLGHYYREKGDSVNARLYYEKAVIVARKNGNEPLALQIESDIQKLK